MLVFLYEADGSVSEHFYENENGFVREIKLVNRQTGTIMNGMMFFESEAIEFVTNGVVSYNVAAIIPDGF